MRILIIAVRSDIYGIPESDKIFLKQIQFQIVQKLNGI